MAITKIDKSNLGYLGSKTQKQIVKLMIENPKWLSIYLDCIKKDKAFFTVKWLTEIVEYTKKTFSDRGATPSYRELDIFLKTNVCKTDDEYLEGKALLKELSGEEILQDIEVGETMGIDALRKAEALYVLDNSRSKIENMKGYSDEIISDVQEKLATLNSVGHDSIECHNPSDLDEVVFNESPDVKVPTGIPELDEQLHGGIPKGSLAMLIAPSGVGKTTFATITCVGAAFKGYNALQIFFEDRESEIVRKHYAAMTGYNTNEFFGEKGKNLLNRFYAENEGFKERLNSNLKFVRMKNSETTVESIRNYVNNLINKDGWKPDVIFVDYLSCLMPSTNVNLAFSNEWQVWERCVKKFEILAAELNVTIWIAQQTNRSGMKKDTANDRMGNIQGSFRAVQPCSFVLYLDKSNQNETQNYTSADLYLDKCRGCCKREWKGVMMDNGTCQIDLSGAVNTVEDLEYHDNGHEYVFNPEIQ